MTRTAPLLVLCLGSLVPLSARAATVDSLSIADGTYMVKVERVIDARHVQVLMDNGSETTLPAGRPTVDFSKVQANDQLKLSLIKGEVVVYLDLTKH